jgi:molybdopterin synthase catalytic subunit
MAATNSTDRSFLPGHAATPREASSPLGQSTPRRALVITLLPDISFADSRKTSDHKSARGDAVSEQHPRFETWLEEIKASPAAPGVGMYLMHNGVVRGTARNGSIVTGMDLSYDPAKLDEIVGAIEARPGVAAVRVWINQGHLAVGDDIMQVIVAGDIRENVFGALQELVRLVKTECVHEWEIR